jgi:hypothetical protein
MHAICPTLILQIYVCVPYNMANSKFKYFVMSHILSPVLVNQCYSKAVYREQKYQIAKENEKKLE